MTWLLRIGGGLVVLVVLAVVVAPMLISKEALTARAEEEATAVLGRQVAIGDVSGVSVFPPRLTIDGLEVANAEGFEAPFLASMDRAQVSVALWPLLSGQVEIRTFRLVSPRIHLEARADGSNNFTLGSAQEGPGAGDEGAAPSRAPLERAPIVGTIEVIDGGVVYAAPDRTFTAEGVDATLVLPPVGQPLTLTAAMQLEGIPADIRVDVEKPWSLAGGSPSVLDLALDLGGNEVRATLDAVLEPLRLTGPMTIGLDQPADLGPLLGQDIVDAAAPFGALGLSGDAEVTEGGMTLRNGRYSSKLLRGSGDLSVATNGERPRLTGSLVAEEADLRPFFPEDMASGQEGGGEEAAGGFPAWSAEEMDFSGLDAADMDLAVGAQRITLPTFELSGVQSRIRIEAGRAALSLTEAMAFGGAASGNLILDARNSQPAINGTFAFKGVDFAEAAPALLSTKRLVGRGSLGVDIATTGSSQKAWIDNLAGTATADIEDGRVAGISLATIANTGLQLADQLEQGGSKVPVVSAAFADLVEKAVSKGATTPFDLANFKLDIARGVTRVSEASLLSDTFRARIGGEVALPSQQIDLSIDLAGKLPETAEYRELKVPVAVSGTFSSPKIRLDTDPLIRSLARDAAGDVLRDAGIELEEGQSVEDALKEKARSELGALLFGRPRKKDEPDDGTEGSGDKPQDR